MNGKSFSSRTSLRLALVAMCSLTVSLAVVQASTAKQSTTTGSASRSPAALHADALFWQTMHSGDYERIQASLVAETAAHLRDPADSTTTAHVGFLHMWRLAERSRLTPVPPTITDEAILARNYFKRAVAQAPDDARYQGFLASAMFAEAAIQHDTVLQQKATRTMRAAIKAWPAFNLFTAGYVMSSLDAHSAAFRRALAMQWSNLDVCAHETVDRQHPNIARLSVRVEVMPAARDRLACNETTIAPHNEEGFFLNMGDMLVKSGDWKTARTIYAAAKRSPGYASWPYRAVLEKRIANARSNVARFSASNPPGSQPSTRMMINSNFSCMACHQR